VNIKIITNYWTMWLEQEQTVTSIAGKIWWSRAGSNGNCMLVWKSKGD